MVKDAHSDSELAYMPSRAFGTQPIKVRSQQFYHNLAISAPTEVQANTEMTVDLDLGGSVEKDTVAMVAVVDEGLLSLTNFKTPDPSDSLFPKMPLDVNTAETVGWGISSPSMDSAPAGGGADGGDARRKAKVVKTSRSLVWIGGCCLEWKSLCHLLYSAVQWLCTRYGLDCIPHSFCLSR